MDLNSSINKKLSAIKEEREKFLAKNTFNEDTKSKKNYRKEVQQPIIEEKENNMNNIDINNINKSNIIDSERNNKFENDKEIIGEVKPIILNLNKKCTMAESLVENPAPPKKLGEKEQKLSLINQEILKLCVKLIVNQIIII